MKTLPTPVRALLQSLFGHAVDPPLTENEQRQLLELADRTHCTLYLTGGNAKNAERRKRLWAAYDEAAATLKSTPAAVRKIFEETLVNNQATTDVDGTTPPIDTTDVDGPPPSE